MKEQEIQYEKPKKETSKFKIYEKIDPTKSLESIINDNIPNFKAPIPNFKAPSDGKEFIENLITLDYIISEKYKNSKSIFDDKANIKRNPGFVDLSLFFKTRNIKVYYDNSISPDFYKHLRKYYKSENNSKKKIRIRLNLNEKVLQDETKVESIVEKIINKVSQIINVKKEDFLDIFILAGFFPLNIAINEIRLINHQAEFEQCLQEIVNQNNGNNIRFVDRNGEDEREDVVVDIREALSHYVTNQGFTPERFDYRYDKLRGSFGRVLFFWNWEFTIKNGNTYYYPNKNCEGYGLKVPEERLIINDENIFESGNWRVVYTNILKNKYYYRINRFPGEYIEKRNNDNSIKKFRLFFQCKARVPSIVERPDGSLRTDDDYLVPYRLIKENLD